VIQTANVTKMRAFKLKNVRQAVYRTNAASAELRLHILRAVPYVIYMK